MPGQQNTVVSTAFGLPVPVTRLGVEIGNPNSTVIPAFRKFTSGRYSTIELPSNDTTVIPAVNTLIVGPFTVGAATAFDRITLEVTATFAAAEHRLGIYADTNGLPDALVTGSEGVIDTHSATGVIPFIFAVTLQPGLYWLASVAQTAGTSATVRGRTAIPSPYVSQVNGGNANSNGYSRIGAVAAALPVNFGPVLEYQAVQPKVMLRAA